MTDVEVRRRTPPRSAVRRLAMARLISLTGGGAAFTALAYIIFARTGGSSEWVSAVLLATFGAQGLLTPFAGGLGDRFDRRKLLIASDLCASAGFIALAFARTPTQMVILAFVTASLEAPFFPVSRAAIPNLAADDEQLSWANGLVGLGVNVGFFVGPILGGGLVALFAGGNTEAQLRVAGYWVYGVNAVSFLVSAGLVASIRAPFAGDRSDAEQHRGVWAGLGFLLRERVLRTITLAWVVLIVGAGFTIVSEVELAAHFGAGSLGYGVLTALWGGGAALGSLAASRLLNPRREPWALLVGSLGIALGLGLVSLAPWFALALALTLVAGTSEGLSSVAELGIVQRRTPDAVRARVMGASDAAFFIAFALSFTFGGVLVEAVGVKASYAIAGVSCLLATAVLLPAVREMRASEAASVRHVQPDDREVAR